jgi:hypothetical protein
MELDQWGRFVRRPKKTEEVTGPLLPHDGKGRFGHVDDAKEIRFNLRMEFREAGVFDWADVAVACVIGEYVQPSERIHGCSNSVTGGLFAGHPELPCVLDLRIEQLSQKVALIYGAVAMSLCPALRTASASARPNPRVLPEMSHTFDVSAVVPKLRFLLSQAAPLLR